MLSCYHPHTDTECSPPPLWLCLLAFSSFFMLLPVPHLQDYVNNQVGGKHKITLHLWLSLLHLVASQCFHIYWGLSVSVSGIALCECLCVSHVSMWGSGHLLFRNRQRWEKRVILRLPHTGTHCCLLTLWVADRKGANCGINRCMLGTEQQLTC